MEAKYKKRFEGFEKGFDELSNKYKIFGAYIGMIKSEEDIFTRISGHETLVNMINKSYQKEFDSNIIETHVGTR